MRHEEKHIQSPAKRFEIAKVRDGEKFRNFKFFELTGAFKWSDVLQETEVVIKVATDLMA